MRVQILRIRNSVEGSCAERRNTASLVVEGEAARAFAWRIRAALWLLLAAMFFAGSAAGQDQKQADLGGLSIEDLAKVKVESVYGASKFLQKASDVPSSVTVVTAEQIQKCGYRTLADVLKSVRGCW